MSIDRDQRMEYIKAWEASGLSKAEFCRQMGISYSRFNHWYYTYLDNLNSLEGEQAKIVPVTVTEKTVVPHPEHLILRMKSSILEIPAGFPADEIKNIIEILL